MPKTKIDKLIQVMEEQHELSKQLSFQNDTKFLRQLVKSLKTIAKETENEVKKSYENVDFYIKLNESMNSLIRIYIKKP